MLIERYLFCCPVGLHLNLKNHWVCEKERKNRGPISTPGILKDWDHLDPEYGVDEKCADQIVLKRQLGVHFSFRSPDGQKEQKKGAKCLSLHLSLQVFLVFEALMGRRKNGGERKVPPLGGLSHLKHDWSLVPRWSARLLQVFGRGKLHIIAPREIQQKFYVEFTSSPKC